MSHRAWPFFFFFEMEFHHVGQAGLELVTSGDSPASASQKCWDNRHKPWCPALLFIFLVETGFPHVGQAGLELLTSSDAPISASPNARITRPALF